MPKRMQRLRRVRQRRQGPVGQVTVRSDCRAPVKITSRALCKRRSASSKRQAWGQCCRQEPSLNQCWGRGKPCRQLCTRLGEPWHKRQCVSRQHVSFRAGGRQWGPAGPASQFAVACCNVVRSQAYTTKAAKTGKSPRQNASKSLRKSSTKSSAKSDSQLATVQGS